MFAALVLLFLSARVEAAPCCAGSSSMPSLITGDENSKLAMSLSYGSVVADAPGAYGGLPVFRDSLSPDENRTVATLSYAHLLDDRVQIGLSAPLVMNAISASGKHSTETNLGDVSVVAAYEWIQELEYSEYKPKVYLFSSFTLPTGRSIYDSSESIAADVSGGGVFQAQAGLLAVKRWSRLDANAGLRVGRSFSQTFTEPVAAGGGKISVAGAWVGAASIGAGYSFAERWRGGLGIESQYQSPHQVLTAHQASTASQRLVWNTSADLSYLVGEHEALSLVYNDQTLMGPAVNTSLARAIALNYLYRWDR